MVGESSTGRTDVGPFPRRGEILPAGPPTLWSHQLRMPEGSVLNWLSHIEKSRRSFDHVLPTLKQISVTLDSAPFLFQNVFEGKGFIGELEISVTYIIMRLPLIYFFLCTINSFGIMRYDSGKNQSSWVFKMTLRKIIFLKLQIDIWINIEILNFHQKLYLIGFRTWKEIVSEDKKKI